MNKKLLAVAVASVLAAPATALAQVTINGIFKVGIEQIKIANPAPTRGQTSQMRVDDNSSRIIFGVTEDLGGGMAAIAQADMRFQPDGGGGPAASGNTWVGLRSSNMGSITLGRHDLHYGKQPDDIASKAGALHATAVSLMDHAAAGVLPVAITSRTANAMRWDSPNWGGFTLTAAYSTAPFGSEGDMTPGATFKGSATNLNPAFTASNWQVGASVWNAKSEGGSVAALSAAQVTAFFGTAGTPAPVTPGNITVNALEYEEEANVLYGYYRLGGWKFGFAVNNSEVKLGGLTLSERQAWTVPVSYTTGAHNFYAHYTKADDDKSPFAAGFVTGAKMFAVAYVYDLSKRTSVGVTYAKIDNSADAAYTFFTGGGALGSADSLPTADGEDPQLIQFTIRHAF
jgi:predicted porin